MQIADEPSMLRNSCNAVGVLRRRRAPQHASDAAAGWHAR
jgi:hypothetical protein